LCSTRCTTSSPPCRHRTWLLSLRLSPAIVSRSDGRQLGGNRSGSRGAEPRYAQEPGKHCCAPALLAGNRRAATPPLQALLLYDSKAFLSRQSPSPVSMPRQSFVADESELDYLLLLCQRCFLSLLRYLCLAIFLSRFFFTLPIQPPPSSEDSSLRRDHTAILARLCSLAKVTFELLVDTRAWRTKLGIVSPIAAPGYSRLAGPGGLELPVKPAESEISAW